MDLIKKWASLLYLRYEMIFCMAMFEPWEKRLINFIVFASLFLMIFSAYVFLPDYLKNLVDMFRSHSTNDGGFQPIS